MDDAAGRAIKQAEGSDGLWIDLTGCAHLHGGEERLA